MWKESTHGPFAFVYDRKVIDEQIRSYTVYQGFIGIGLDRLPKHLRDEVAIQCNLAGRLGIDPKDLTIDHIKCVFLNFSTTTGEFVHSNLSLDRAEIPESLTKHWRVTNATDLRLGWVHPSFCLVDQYGKTFKSDAMHVGNNAYAFSLGNFAEFLYNYSRDAVKALSVVELWVQFTAELMENPGAWIEYPSIQRVLDEIGYKEDPSDIFWENNLLRVSNRLASFGTRKLVQQFKE